MRDRLWGLFAVVIAAGLLIMFAAPVLAVHYVDDFSTSTGWLPGTGWSIYQPGSGQYVYRGDSSPESYSWQPYWVVDSSFIYQADLTFQTLYNGSSGTASLVFSSGASAPSVSVLVDVTYSSSQAVLVQVSYLQSSAWHTVLNSGWKSGVNKSCHVTVTRQPGSDYLTVSVTNGSGFSYTANTTSIGAAFLNGVICNGLRVVGAVVDFDNVDLLSPIDQIALTGTVTLQNYSLDNSIFNVRIELRDPVTGVASQRYYAPLNSVGTYVVNNAPTGTYDVAYKAGSWLQKIVRGVAIVPYMTTTVNVSLTGGDLDGDNHVGTPDFSILSGNFDKSGD